MKCETMAEWEANVRECIRLMEEKHPVPDDLWLVWIDDASEQEQP